VVSRVSGEIQKYVFGERDGELLGLVFNRKAASHYIKLEKGENKE